jgi:hypothetical protein
MDLVAARTLRLLVATLTLWCLGCDAFEQIAKSVAATLSPVGRAAPTDEGSSLRRIAETNAIDADAAAGADAAHSCHCVLGHAVVLSAAAVLHCSAPPVTDFVAGPRAVLLPAPEPPLRPPVA